MADFFDYAPINQTLTYNESDRYSRDRDMLGDAPSDPYAVDEDYYLNLAIKRWKMCPTKVAREYFSVTNIKRIQRDIRREIHNRSYGKFRLVEDQNVLDLVIVMVVVYDQYSKNLPTQIIRQVKRLNDHTVQYIAPDMMTNLKQHYSYLSDIKNPINPLPEPINVNHAGRLQLQGFAQHYGL